MKVDGTTSPRNIDGRDRGVILTSRNVDAVDLNPSESHHLVPESCVAGNLVHFLVCGGD